MTDARVRLLQVDINQRLIGQLVHQSQFEFRYLMDDPIQAPVGLLMPASRLSWRDNALFPVMDQNLPEGDLFNRLRQLFPKQEMTAMRLLAMIGSNGIGRLGYRLPGQSQPPPPQVISRQRLMQTPFSTAVFDELVAAYLSTGAGVSGMQPKIMVLDRTTVPVPNLIVKTGSDTYPGLAANEFLCMRAAHRAGIETAQVDLTDDGGMLLVDRFDIGKEGERYGFEDIASLMGLRVRDTLADRKYHGSYQQIANLLSMIVPDGRALVQFFEQLAFSIMVGNGDAHLKNFAVLYDGQAEAPANIRLAPMFDVVSTRLYRYQRSPGGAELEDNTLALRLFSGAKYRSRTYPTKDELLRFGRQVCHVSNPELILDRLAQGMSETLALYRRDERVGTELWKKMDELWGYGMGHARP